MKGTSLQSICDYACFTLALKPVLNRPSDGRMQPEIPASNLAWTLVLGALLRLNSANRLEWLVRSANRPRQRRIVRSVTPMISVAAHHVIFFAIAFNNMSCSFIIRSTSAAGHCLGCFTHPASPAARLERTDHV